MTALTADRIGGLIWVCVGAAIVYGSWTMDRLETLNIPPATAPGVVPGLLGLGIVVLGMVLLARRNTAAPETSAPSFARADTKAGEQDAPFDLKRVLLSWTLCLIYGALLLGRGIPYWLLTFVFLFAHMMLLDDTERVPAAFSLRRLVIAAVVAAAVAIIVALVFRYAFLVRLP
jgi:Tripartite tricarboxylate transporter TctB family